ncbi:hypothetical protein [Acinetobacter modestus]|uniref:hypothetical protein n=1 Tax=Acinetobacter modestus TaxID=1776740 RepID=UPI001F4BA53A|nr:hypothetical protein [Acinetobacter modestus]MCH7334376.1 hypothetical protein [Acinetobacter modestus]
MKNIILGLSIAMVSLGCFATEGVITSLEDMTTESNKKGFFKIPQYRVVSVPGNLPFVDVGSIQFYKADRKPSAAIGLSKGGSYILESKIESKCDLDNCLKDIRDGLVLLKDKAENLVEARINLSKAQYEGKEDSELKAEYKKTKEDFQNFHVSVLNKINQSGVIIYRWNAKKSNNSSLKLSSIFGLGKKEDKTYSGFALVSGLRTATLFVGKDLLETRCDLAHSSKYSNRYELTTYVAQAKYIIYVTEYDLQQVVDSKLEASYSQLSNPSKTLKELDKIEINNILSKAQNLSNTGIISGVKRDYIEVNWGDGNLAKDAAAQGILDKLNEWHTFYSVQSDLTDIMKMMDKGKFNNIKCDNLKTVS